ncbi:hypothetical protein DP49_5230 [Burkholderia pseudomallei]|nr:hypothetical protein DP49_5230 [Burkholderia pseudomallei]
MTSLSGTRGTWTVGLRRGGGRCFRASAQGPAGPRAMGANRRRNRDVRDAGEAYCARYKRRTRHAGTMHEARLASTIDRTKNGFDSGSARAARDGLPAPASFDRDALSSRRDSRRRRMRSDFRRFRAAGAA